MSEPSKIATKKTLSCKIFAEILEIYIFKKMYLKTRKRMSRNVWLFYEKFPELKKNKGLGVPKPSKLQLFCFYDLAPKKVLKIISVILSC